MRILRRMVSLCYYGTTILMEYKSNVDWVVPLFCKWKFCSIVSPAGFKLYEMIFMKSKREMITTKMHLWIQKIQYSFCYVFVFCVNVMLLQIAYDFNNITHFWYKSLNNSWNAAYIKRNSHLLPYGVFEAFWTK